MAFLDEKSKSEKLYRIIFSQKYQNNDKTAKKNLVILKVRQIRNIFFKLMFLPKNERKQVDE